MTNKETLTHIAGRLITCHDDLLLSQVTRWEGSEAHYASYELELNKALDYVYELSYWQYRYMLEYMIEYSKDSTTRLLHCHQIVCKLMDDLHI